MPGPIEIGGEVKDASSREGVEQHLVSADQATGRSTRFPAVNYEASAVLTAGVLFCIGIALQVTPLNGSFRLTGWEWPWRGDIDTVRAIVFLLLPFAGVHYALRKAENQPIGHVPVYLGILALGNYLMQIMGVLTDPRGIELIQRIVLSQSATSYFSDASRIGNLISWLAHFDRATLGLHSSTHPPGPILFYFVFFKLFGSQTGALIGGCAVGFLGSLGVFVTYAFAGLWTNNRHTRILASALYALLPATSLFFPELDQVYPILSMLLILFWCRSFESKANLSKEAVYFGLTLAVTLFFAYNLLTVGAFLACYAFYWLWRQGWTGRSFATLLRNSGVGLSVCAGVYALLWLVTGYDPIAAFFNALSNQAVFAAFHNRSNALFALFDPLGFFLVSGMMVLPLVLFLLIRNFHAFKSMPEHVALTLMGLAVILTIDLTGVLRGEAARVWLFLQPLVVVPAALELARFEWRWRLAIFSMQWLIVAFLKANLGFVNP